MLKRKAAQQKKTLQEITAEKHHLLKDMQNISQHHAQEAPICPPKYELNMSNVRFHLMYFYCSSFLNLDLFKLTGLISFLLWPEHLNWTRQICNPLKSCTFVDVYCHYLILIVMTSHTW